ncbi:transcription factor HES-4-A-like [Limulus polyphemus]|uniref:Transcription factor HES-4-A-like n=1 Tax=Limulus polyphemus TaxID=6850 RepID=A0ABM1B6Q8_LIMPO|nr:transcription factor HES-4-A-like [Limulus polyphemus]
MPSEKSSMKTSENRRSTKPIMEKRRRARINNSLGELKNLILDALKKDNARHSKLEKADILEMTVKHLQNLQRQQITACSLSDPSAMSKFRAGFNECANEVSRYLSGMKGIDLSVRQRLMNHLADCLSGLSPTYPQTSGNYSLPSLSPVHIQVPASTTTIDTKLFEGIQLVPTRLQNGEIAFLLPGEGLTNQNHLSTYSPVMSSIPSGPVSVLGSSGILSPAASDRSLSSPSPVTYTSTTSPVLITSGPVFEPISPAPFHQQEKPETEHVWRPW